jgi:hypothetical protein
MKYLLIFIVLLSSHAEAQLSSIVVRNDTIFNYNPSTGVYTQLTKAGRSSVPVGYATGTGGAVTQATNKGTGVTINKICGQITTHNAALAAAAEVKFTVTNNQVTSSDVVFACIVSGGTSGAYFLTVSAVGNGSFDITLGNTSTGSLSQALVINFLIFKSSTQ